MRQHKKTKTICRTVFLGSLALFAVTACSQEPETTEIDFSENTPAPEDPAADQLALYQANDPWKFGQGESMAETVCSACHAITLTDFRPHQDAPAFRDLSLTHDLNALKQRFEAGILTDHPAMPEFQFEPEEVDSLLYYIESLQLPE